MPRNEPKASLDSRRRRLSIDAIVKAAQTILDESGLDGLTTIAVARRLGVSQPALYSHFSGLEELQQEIAFRGAQELSDLVTAAIRTDAAVSESLARDADSAIFAMAHAYRDYVRRHPDRYLLQLSAPRSEKYVEATELSAEPVRGVLRGYGLSEPEVRESHVAFRAAVHGFVHLEARNALTRGSQATEHFDFFIALFASGLRAMAGRSSPSTQKKSKKRKSALAGRK